MQAMQVYDFAMGAGGFAQIPVAGAYYRIMSADGPVAIKEDVGSTCGPLLPGQGMRGRKFSSLTIVDKSGAANAGQLIVAGSDFIDDRVHGDVAVVPSVKARSMAGNSLMACGYAEGVDTFQLVARLQFYNPPGSGKNVFLTALRFDTFGKAAVATIESTWDGTQINGGRSKRGGGAAGVLQVLEGPSDVRPTFMGAMIAAGSFFEQFSDAIVLPPGKGLTIKAIDEYTALMATAEFFEENA